MNQNSIVVIHSLNQDGKIIKQGSGVILSSDFVATNCHVIQDGNSIKIGKDGHYMPASLSAGNIEKDICVISVKNIKGKGVVFGKTSQLKIGETIYAIGAPQGLELSLSDGIVSQLRGSNPPIIQITAAISPGSSGGGLFNNKGQLIGLTTAQRKDGQNLNFAIPIEYGKGMKEYDNSLQVPDQILDAIKYNDCPLNNEGICDPKIIKINRFDDIQKAKKAGFDVDINLMSCKDTDNCVALTNILRVLNITDIDLGPYQINYQAHPNTVIKEYFVELFARENAKKILSTFIEKHGYSWETLGRYKFSPEKAPEKNARYYRELYQYVYDANDTADDIKTVGDEKYLNQIKQIVLKQTYTPKNANLLHQWGETVVQFTITADGISDKIRIKKSSGFTLLDATARQIIKSSTPFFPIPIQDTQIEIPITFKDTRRSLDSYWIKPKKNNAQDIPFDNNLSK
jgi:TonB family protein